MTGWFLPHSRLDDLIRGLRDDGFEVVGPVAQDGVIRLQPVTGAEELAQGWKDQQGAGSYRLEHEPAGPTFAASHGPDSAKRWLHPPQETLFRSRRTDQGLVFEATPAEAPPVAMLGLRACDVQARLIQDRVLLERDPGYRQRRDNMLVVAVQCTRSGPNCFCSDMGCGPQVEDGADLVLTELAEGFWLQVRTSQGQRVVEPLRLERASPEMGETASQRVRETGEAMRGRFDPEGARQSLLANLEHPHWEEVAQRCLDLVTGYGLVSGSIDLILTPAGEYVFLELNVHGEWGWQHAAGLPIASAVARWLAASEADPLPRTATTKGDRGDRRDDAMARAGTG